MQHAHHHGADAPGLATPELAHQPAVDLAPLGAIAAPSSGLTSPERISALHAIRARHRGEAFSTQRARLLEALQTLGHVTTFEASRYLDLYDPRARKMELVRAGHDTLMTWRSVQTESGERHRIGVYALKKAVVHGPTHQEGK